MDEWKSDPEFEEQIARSFNVSAAREEFKDNLHARLMQQARQKPAGLFTIFGLRPAWAALALLFITLIVGTLAIGPQRVYAAVARLFSLNDPGLQSVQETGMLNNLDITAQPTTLPTRAPTPAPLPPQSLDLSQTLGNVTLSIDWAYFDPSLFGLGMSHSPLPAGLELGDPEVKFNGVDPVQVRGWIQAADNSSLQDSYVSYQVITSSETAQNAAVAIDVPLIQSSGQKIAVGNFHFDIGSLQVYPYPQVSLQKTYSIKYNGVEVRLENARVSTDETAVSVCFAPPDSAAWTIQKASVQLDGGSATPFSAVEALDAQDGLQCARLNFPTANTGSEKQLLLHITQLASSQKVNLEGQWDFYVDLPRRAVFPGQAQAVQAPKAASYGVQTMKDISITLDWAFVDAKRTAVGYTIHGLKIDSNVLSILGTIELKDAQGKSLNRYGGGSSPTLTLDAPSGDIHGSWSMAFDQPLTQTEAKFQLDITLGGTQREETLGYFPVAPDATFPKGFIPGVAPETRIGAYHFEFTTTIHPMQVLTDLPPVKNNNVEMTVSRVEMSPSMTDVLLCYNKPSASDWWIMDADLDTGAGKTAQEGGAMIYDANYQLKPSSVITWKAPDSIKTVKYGRCVKLTFPLGNAGRSGTVTLTINELQVSPPEVIPADLVKAAQAKLKAQGIEIDYVTMSGQGGGGGGPVYKSLPAGMTEQEAWSKFMEALGYVQAGPWVFTFEVGG